MKYLKTFEQNNQETVVEYYPNGQKYREEYFLKNRSHRIDGPASQHWYENGQKEREMYYVNGSRHREDGPAIQTWWQNGIKQYDEYCLDNVEYSKEKWIEQLKKIKSPHYEEQLLKYNTNKYNI
jgi:antitoxin component YwqK of YwqJK toxin-antitoxin module